MFLITRGLCCAAVGLAIAMAVTACSDEAPKRQDRAQERVRVPEVASVGGDLPGAGAPSDAVSWAERVNMLPADEQRYMERMDTRFSGALKYHSPGERDQLVRMGFPTIEEWAAAGRMSDAELKALAASGSAKAKALYANRLIDRLEEVDRRSAAQPSSGVERERMFLAAEATQAAESAVRAARNPFAAYVMGAQRSALYQGATEPRLAGLFAARAFGDPRAASLLMQTNARAADPAAILAVYSAILTAGKR